MTREQAINSMISHGFTVEQAGEIIKAVTLQEPTTKNDLGVDCISKKNALRVANNEYLRGFHNALCKALNETYSIHCDEGHFRVIQKETLVGLGMSMESALGPDAESFMNTLPLVTPQLSVPEVTALAEWTEKLTKASEDAYNKGYEAGMKAQEPRWIPCSERLPETDDEVLCWYEYYHWSQEKVLPEYGIGCYFKETSKWYGEVAVGRDVRVIAWMPLQSYKAETEE